MRWRAGLTAVVIAMAKRWGTDQTGQEKAKAKESMGQVMSDGTADLNRRQVVGREGKHTKMDLLATGPIASWSKSSDIRSQKKIFEWSQGGQRRVRGRGWRRRVRQYLKATSKVKVKA